MVLTDIRIKVRNFIKRNKWKVILFFVAWAILTTISTIVVNWKSDTPITTYTPHSPIMENGETVPEKWKENIEEMLATYIGYCNQKDYENAYQMIREDCRKTIYPTLENFKAYVDYVFEFPKVYTIQNYANRDKRYIYRIRLFEDILATGLTYEDSLQYFEEQIVFTEEQGKLQLAVKGYIESEEINKVYEDQYMRITISNKTVNLDEETYTIRIQNKTEYAIVLADTIEQDEISLETENGSRPMLTEENWQTVYLPPQKSNTYIMKFEQFYDEGVNTTGMKFGQVRVLRSYSGEEEQKSQELAEAVALYSVTIPL